jgi:1-acyl-sn-glycerol-3-phosphate acyltransferase
MIKQFLILIIFGIIITLKRTNKNAFVNFTLNVCNANIKVRGLKNLKNFNNKRIIIMANHINGFDAFPIVYALTYYTNDKKKIYVIAKHNVLGDKTDKNLISNTLSLFKGHLYNKFDIIPYERNNKISGDIVKQTMLEKIDEGETILLFPEGKPTRTGIPTEFKPGSFRLCAENKIEILPITLQFDKDIGLDTKDPVKIEDWFNVNTTIHIHESIYNKNWEKFMNLVFDKIREPLIKN